MGLDTDHISALLPFNTSHLSSSSSSGSSGGSGSGGGSRSGGGVGGCGFASNTFPRREYPGRSKCRCVPYCSTIIASRLLLYWTVSLNLSPNLIVLSLSFFLSLSAAITVRGLVGTVGFSFSFFFLSFTARMI